MALAGTELYLLKGGEGRRSWCCTALRGTRAGCRFTTPWRPRRPYMRRRIRVTARRRGPTGWKLLRTRRSSITGSLSRRAWPGWTSWLRHRRLGRRTDGRHVPAEPAPSGAGERRRSRPQESEVLDIFIIPWETSDRTRLLRRRGLPGVSPAVRRRVAGVRRAEGGRAYHVHPHVFFGPLCTTRRCRACWARSRCRRWWCGAPTTPSFRLSADGCISKPSPAPRCMKLNAADTGRSSSGPRSLPA